MTKDAKNLYEVYHAGQAPDHLFDGKTDGGNCAHFFRGESIAEAERLRRTFNVLANIGRFHGERQNDTYEDTRAGREAPLFKADNDSNSRTFRYWAKVGGVKLCEDIYLAGTQPTIPQTHSCSYDVPNSKFSTESLKYRELMLLFPMAFTDASSSIRLNNFMCKILENQYIFIHHLGI